jgi:hypothetical protein
MKTSDDNRSEKEKQMTSTPDRKLQAVMITQDNATNYSTSPQKVILPDDY